MKKVPGFDPKVAQLFFLALKASKNNGQTIKAQLFRFINNKLLFHPWIQTTSQTAHCNFLGPPHHLPELLLPHFALPRPHLNPLFSPQTKRLPHWHWHCTSAGALFSPQTKRLPPWHCTSAGAIPKERLSSDLPSSTSAQAFQVLRWKALHQQALGADVKWLRRWRQPWYFDAPTQFVAISSRKTSFWNNQYSNVRSAQHVTTVYYIDLKMSSVNYTVGTTDRFGNISLQRKLFVKCIIINWDG